MDSNGKNKSHILCAQIAKFRGPWILEKVLKNRYCQKSLNMTSSRAGKLETRTSIPNPKWNRRNGPILVRDAIGLISCVSAFLSLGRSWYSIASSEAMKWKFFVSPTKLPFNPKGNQIYLQTKQERQGHFPIAWIFIMLPFYINKKCALVKHLFFSRPQTYGFRKKNLDPFV